MPRTFGTILIGKLAEEKSEAVASECKTRIADMEHYNKTGELVYLDEGETQRIKGDAESVKEMKAELTTIEEFDSIGSVVDVGRKYNISPNTAHGWKMSLRSKAKQSGKQLLPGTDNQEIGFERQKSIAERISESFMDEYTNGGKLEACEANVSKKRKGRPLTKIRPSREQLAQDQLTMSKDDAILKYAVSKTTMEAWTRDYKLPYWTQARMRETRGNSEVVTEKQNEPSEIVATDITGICTKVGKVEDCGGNVEMPFAEEVNRLDCFGMHNRHDAMCLECCDRAECINNTVFIDPAEPEPAWEPELVSDATPEQLLWMRINETVAEILELKYREAEKEVKGRLKELVGGVK